MREFLSMHGGWAAWLFNIALAVQVIRNLWQKKYGSGDRWTWYMFIVGHSVFGVHLWLTSTAPGAIAQGIALLCDIVLLTQSYTMKWKK